MLFDVRAASRLFQEVLGVPEPGVHILVALLFRGLLWNNVPNVSRG